MPQPKLGSHANRRRARYSCDTPAADTYHCHQRSSNQQPQRPPPTGKPKTKPTMGKYTASDGKEFDTKREWRKYEMLLMYTFKEKTDHTFPMKKPGDVNGQQFDMMNLTKCEAVVADSTDMVQIDECVDCKVFLGASGESVFIRDCKGCTFYVACKQLRLRDCHDCKFSLYSQTEPVIETSDGIVFTPFAGGFDGQENCMRSVNLDPKINFWWGIFDFNDEAKTGKNFKVVNKPMEPWWPLGESVQVCEQTAPNSATLPSTLTDDGGGHGGPSQMNSFKIGTSAEDAQNKVDSQAPPPPPDLELIPDEVQKPAADWTAFRVGVRYDPPLLALEWKGDGKTLRKDSPFPEVTELAALVAEVADDECAAAVLDHMVKTHGAQWLDFEKFFSKKQVLRLVDMVLQGGPDSVEM
jgi:hypothetical protein